MVRSHKHAKDKGQRSIGGKMEGKMAGPISSPFRFCNAVVLLVFLLLIFYGIPPSIVNKADQIRNMHIWLIFTYWQHNITHLQFTNISKLIG